ncbi:hypothetical protein E4U57_004731 [Claviceps arundinis]|uniref:Uncharacterized protein n=1 Tax=Claviceps arundinis TaxID=1623583 RepID=A0ABQ7PIJ5_9HYPO|nr:hypothetical protein E4U57_004731 [Claviceps arundinis]
MNYTYDSGTSFGALLAEFKSLYQKAGVPSSKMKQELWDTIPADMDTSLSKKSVDPDVDYEQLTEEASRAAYSMQRARAQRQKGSSSRYAGKKNQDGQGAQGESVQGPRA